MSGPSEAKADFGLAIMEPIAKVVAVFTAVSLGLAFLFDVAFFATLRSGMWGVLVLADHIETAIAMVPVIVVLMVVLYPLLWIFQPAFHIRLRTRIVVIVSMAATLVVLAIVDGATPSAVIGAAYIFLVFSYTVLFAPKSNFNRSFAVYLGVVLVLTAVTLGVTRAQRLMGDIQKRIIDDVVWLHDMSSVNGKIVRMVDRGAIVGKTDGDIVFMFIPKDQIKRVDTRPDSRLAFGPL